MKHLIALILLFPIFLFSQETNTFIDSRDSIVYKTVKIGEQWWMAENLKFKPSKNFNTQNNRGKIMMRDKESNKNYIVTFVSYNLDESYVPIYGYLYDWETACTVCPDGWRLPNENDWWIMLDILGGKKVAGTKMKEAEGTHWKTSKSKIKITNSSGFSALPGGSCDQYLDFHGLGEKAIFWTSGILFKNSHWLMRLSIKKNSIIPANLPPEYFFSVRCIKN